MPYTFLHGGSSAAAIHLHMARCRIVFVLFELTPSPACRKKTTHNTACIGTVERSKVVSSNASLRALQHFRHDQICHALKSPRAGVGHCRKDHCFKWDHHALHFLCIGRESRWSVTAQQFGALLYSLLINFCIRKRSTFKGSAEQTIRLPLSDINQFRSEVPRNQLNSKESVISNFNSTWLIGHHINQPPQNKVAKQVWPVTHHWEVLRKRKSSHLGLKFWKRVASETSKVQSAAGNGKWRNRSGWRLQFVRTMKG